MCIVFTCRGKCWRGLQHLRDPPHHHGQRALQTLVPTARQRTNDSRTCCNRETMKSVSFSNLVAHSQMLSFSAVWKLFQNWVRFCICSYFPAYVTNTHVVLKLCLAVTWVILATPSCLCWTQNLMSLNSVFEDTDKMWFLLVTIISALKTWHKGRLQPNHVPKIIVLNRHASSQQQKFSTISLNVVRHSGQHAEEGEAEGGKQRFCTQKCQKSDQWPQLFPGVWQICRGAARQAL